MPDRVHLLINDKLVENFLSYSVESNLFTADDAFRLELADPEVKVTEGLRCELYVNGELELSGIVDRVTDGYDKSGKRLTLEGRDLMGLLVDSCCEEFSTHKDVELLDLAQKLVKDIPYINKEKIIYSRGNKNAAAAQTQKKEIFESVQAEPGETVFEVLKNSARSRGLLFFSLPDGTFVFGQPRTSGKAEYTLASRKDGKGNNIIRADRTRDISKRYSRVTVMGQKQGTNAAAPEENNGKETEEDKDFPFRKPFVSAGAPDVKKLKEYAKILMEKHWFDAFQLSYKTCGHSQGGTNYQVNAVCRVDDEIYGIKDDFLIYGRTFELSREGVFTTLRLSKLGVLPG